MLRLPDWKDGVLEFPIFDGFAFWMLSPIMLVLAGLWLWNLRWAWKEPILWLVLELCFLHILVLCAHKTLGGWQFGNRYTVDLLPCVFVGLVVLLRRQKELPWVIFTPLLLWGMGLNLVGTIGVMNHWLAG